MSVVRRISWLLWLLTTFLVSSLVSSHHLTRHRREDTGPASREVAHNVFSFTSTGLYISMFIITEDGVMVIDPDNVGHSRAMLAAIREKTRAPIRYLIYSHNHWDHSKGGEVWKAEGATVVSHIEAYEFIRANPSPGLVVPDLTWSGDRWDLRLGGLTLQLFYFGLSHGLGMTSFLLPQHRLGFIADTVTPGRLPFQYFPDFNIPGLERTLENYLELEVDQIVFSHSANTDPLEPGSKADLQFVLDYIQVLTLTLTVTVTGSPLSVGRM